MDNRTRALAAQVCSVNFEDFPSGTIHKAKLHLLDTLGVALAGSRSPETRAVLDVLGVNGHGTSGIWGLPLSADARTAALINGISAHAFELDDSGGCDHSGAVVVPAALAALSQAAHVVDGRILLRSVLLGYEVGRRVLEAVGAYEEHNGLGWHSTGTCGPFGAATAVAALLDADKEATASALGTSCSFAGGTWAFIHNGSPTKKLHAGRAAEGGLMAAYLAVKGFEGPNSVFETETWGSFFETFGGKRGNIDLLTADFGARWRLDRCSIKPHATCRGTHSGIDALDLLIEKHGIDADDITDIKVDISKFQFGMCGGKTIESRAQAQMSLPYALAARLLYGKVFLAELEQEAWSAPGVAPALERIAVRIDPTMADEDEPAITITTRDGIRDTLVVDAPLGGPENPLSDDKIIEKFASLSFGIVTPERVSELRDFVLDLENRTDARELLKLLQ
jgi:2-methylcitrate dehydratase PrpD